MDLSFDRGCQPTSLASRSSSFRGGSVGAPCRCGRRPAVGGRPGCSWTTGRGGTRRCRAPRAVARSHVTGQRHVLGQHVAASQCRPTTVTRAGRSVRVPATSRTGTGRRRARAGVVAHSRRPRPRKSFCRYVSRSPPVQRTPAVATRTGPARRSARAPAAVGPRTRSAAPHAPGARTRQVELRLPAGTALRSRRRCPAGRSARRAARGSRRPRRHPAHRRFVHVDPLDL